MRSMDCADQIFPNESKTNSSAVEANRNKLQEPGLSTHQTSAPDRKSDDKGKEGCCFPCRHHQNGPLHTAAFTNIFVSR
ncbi:hypothetical protein GUJ93_ZPchr0006g42342 [Zizania palustris]|uniref:Uncharacterized protein n=1 Tax=Zizania palustris TaxID=103762 RepID=A0A8J5T4E6_ZIZPA|nr:hypothetical protein GUJ93_ZPchr0006g42342 [Zizania palustris]